MNDYEEIQKLYEEGYRGQSIDPIKPSNSYPAQQDWGPYSRPIPGSPESSGYSAYRQNQVSNKITRIIDEEKPIKEKAISKLEVIAEIDSIMVEVDPESQFGPPVIYALGEVKKQIIAL